MAASKTQKIGFKALKAVPEIARKPILQAAIAIRRMRMKTLQTPINLTLYVTNRCNAMCKHCFYAGQLNKVQPELTLRQVEKIAKSLKHPVKTLMISGGEPFLRNDLPEICAAFVNFNRTKRISLDTNGILSDTIIRSVSRILKENEGLTLHIQVSLDGPEAVHDEMRGVKGCYEKAIETLRRLEELGKQHKSLELSAMTTICDINFDSIEEFSKDFAEEHPLVLHKFNIMRGATIGTYGLSEEAASDLNPNIRLTKSPEEMETLFSKLRKNISKNRDKVWQNFQVLKWEYMVAMLKDRKPLLKCTARYTFAVIYPNGDVAICEPMKPIGNLIETDFDFAVLWNSKKAEAMKKRAGCCFCIHPCNLLDSMAYDANAILRACRLE